METQQEALEQLIQSGKMPVSFITEAALNAYTRRTNLLLLHTEDEHESKWIREDVAIQNIQQLQAKVQELELKLKEIQLIPLKTPGTK